MPRLIARYDRQPLAYAGLWEMWRDPRINENLYSDAILTGRANETLRPLNDRMPVILPSNAWDL